MRLKKLASTKDTFNGLINETLTKEDTLHQELLQKNRSTEYTFPDLQPPHLTAPTDINLNHQFNPPSSVQWCSDGGSFVTTSEDCGIRLYISSPTLLQDNDGQLIPFLRSFRPTSIICSELHPSSSIYNGFCASLVSAKDIPLRLSSLIPDEQNSYQTLKIYQTQNYQTEEFLKVHSVSFINESIFAAGSNRLVSIFDTNRSEPIVEVKSTAGINSCIIGTNSEFTVSGGFFTGSFSKNIQLFDKNCNVVESALVKTGNGITQLLESSNGKYLYVISRNSKSIDILDIRMGLNQIAQVDGFSSDNQRLKGDLLPNSQGLLIGNDAGDLLWYKDIELGMACEPDVIQLSDAAVSSVQINPKESSILAIATGDRSSSQAQVSLQQFS